MLEEENLAEVQLNYSVVGEGENKFLETPFMKKILKFNVKKVQKLFESKQKASFFALLKLFLLSDPLQRLTRFIYFRDFNLLSLAFAILSYKKKSPSMSLNTL